MFFIPVPITFPVVSVMYMFLSFTVQVGDSLITVKLHWQNFCFQYEYKERISQKVRKFVMLSLSFSPQYDFSVNGDGLQIWKVAADSWQGCRPQVWGLGKWLGTPLKMQHVTNVKQIMDLNGFSGTTHATENIYKI